MEKYTMDVVVPSYMVDIKSRLRATSFMELAQEVANGGVELLKLSDAYLKAVNGVWILGKMHVRFVRTPHRFDKLSLSTWHKDHDGVIFIRDYEMKDEKGEPCVLATSTWVVMDIKERKILHGRELRQLISSGSQCQESAIEAPCPKIIFPGNAEIISKSTHRVSYSDIDYNLHANNTKYISWAMDVLPYELTVEKDLKEFFINFNHEAQEGEEIEILTCRKDDEYYVEGHYGQAQIFIAKFIF